MQFGSIASTGRSIAATGTINASGQDYAEYMLKSPDCGEIKAGDICGVNSKGEITDRFDDAISFVIKSTNPSYVGGDNWWISEQYPEKPEFNNDLSAYEYNEKIDNWLVDKKEWERRYEAERVKHDRIAFSGQVPCNVYDAMPGEYIIPTRTAEGSITGVSAANPSFDQYRATVGRVWKVLDDGRAWVAVKIG